MTQKAAASLSSSLFARKGKASPASLLISELEAANGGSAGGMAGKLAANGSARRKPKAEADLPLLAYVEAQTENESENDNRSEAPDAAAAEILIGAEAAAGEESPVEAAKASPPSRAELPPAASLLDRGAKPLRRTNGRATAVPAEASVAEQDAAAPQTVQAAVQEAARTEDETAREDAMKAETVSGDANVAAIEDASDDDIVVEAAMPAADETAAEPAVETESVESEAEVAATDDAPLIVDAPDKAAAVEVKAGAEVVVVPPLAEEPGTGKRPAEDAVAAAEPPAKDAPAAKEKAAAETAPAEEARPRAAVAAASQDKAAAAIAASVALRHAKTLIAEPTLRARAPSFDDKPRTAASSVVPPRPRVAGQPSRSYLWRGAALVALGAALGFGAYLAFSGKPAEPPAPVAAALPEAAPQAVPETAAAAAPAEDAAAPAAVAPEVTATQTPPAAAAPVLPEPSFDIIRIEPDGQSIIAGRAEPFSEWILLNNGTPIASVRADVNGEWVVLPDASLVPGANAFSLVPKTERGKVAIPAPDDAAPQQAPANEAVAPAPGSDAGSAVEGALQEPEALPTTSLLADLVLPKPKPLFDPAAAALPGRVQVSSDGAYEVQLASVRQTTDAARERDRLASAFPDLLGDLGLRVQEAAVEGAGIFYRVRSGAIADLGLAREICRRLEAGGQGCLVVRRAAEAAAPEPVTELVEDLPAAPAVSAAGQQAERPQ